jgi:hypothetical protein
MERNQSNETVLQLVQSFQNANQALVESAVSVQERNMQFVQRLYSDWLATLQDHTHNHQALMQEMEQQGQKQQEAFQKLVQQSVTSYFDSLTAGLAFFAPTLRLTEKLQICLLALASRYPRHMVNINEEVLGPQTLGAEGWRAADLIELLQNTAPELLQAKARLEVTTLRKGIYLLERSEEMPAFWVYCGGMGEKTPPYRGDMAIRQAEQAQRRDEALGGHVGELQTAVQ